jgi:fatty-acyl-CoA synthase
LTDWNFADVYEAIAGQIPTAPCLIQGHRHFTWSDFNRRADGLAADMLQAGLERQAKVAAYLLNSPEYLETYLAAFKAGMVPVNTNFRYGSEEIRYLFDNADAEAVVFDTSFTRIIEQVRDRLSKVRRWYAVDNVGAIPAWAVAYEDVVAQAPVGGDPVRGPWGRSGDDLLLLYTGGTTGMPKGVMWRQDDLFNALGAGGNPMIGLAPATSVPELTGRTTGPGLSTLPACPLMHGTGQFASFITFNLGGSVVLLEGGPFDPAHMWRTVEQFRVNAVVIVGDAFARPMLAELRAHHDSYDVSSVFVISSSGVMWSQETKQGLLELVPHAVLIDQLGSSEAIGLASSLSTAGNAEETARFAIGDRVRVFTDDGRQLQPGSDEVGSVAICGYTPLGYYKDPSKTAITFRTIDGVRYSIPGDYAQVNADGSLRLLGRGSVVINTGGEKVYPEEVEEALKQHPAVADAVCVGIPDDRFNETVCAIVEALPGMVIEKMELIEHVKAHLAGYKAPRRVIVVGTIGRSPAGKVDYKGLQAIARADSGVKA